MYKRQPYVFGRGGEEALYLVDRNVEVEVVPGVSSSVAALAAAGIPITYLSLIHILWVSRI